MIKMYFDHDNPVAFNPFRFTIYVDNETTAREYLNHFIQGRDSYNPGSPSFNQMEALVKKWTEAMDSGK